jgi:hypothetical protein
MVSGNSYIYQENSNLNFFRESNFEKPAIYSENMAPLLFTLKPQFIQPVRTNVFNKSIQDRLQAINNLPLNWDGQDAVQIKREVIKNTVLFLEIIGEKRINYLDLDNIMPTPYGTIELDWQKPDYLISVEIGINKIGFFSKLPDKSNPSSNGFVFNGSKITNELTQVFDKFFQA